MSQTDFSNVAYSIDELAKRSPIRRSGSYKQIAAGKLRARKVGGRTIVLEEDRPAFLASAPVIAPARSAATPTAPPRWRGRPRKVPVNAVTETIGAQTATTSATAKIKGSHTRGETGAVL